MENNPAVSVIIPLYNAEKYIGACLDSLLAQTFQDFEIIVADDCSTDSGVDIVNGYAPKFGGRLTLTGTEKNSGGGGYVPRNIGLRLSRGKYIFFVDADDFLVETALEILNAVATQYNADVVYTSSYYFYENDRKISLAADNMSACAKENGVLDKMTLTIDDPDGNFQRLLFKEEIPQTPWAKFIAREFLIRNKIDFPKIISGGDFLWTIQILYYAKRFLRLPIPLYFYRINSSSLVNRKKISFCAAAFLAGARALYDLSNKIDLLKKNPAYLNAALKVFLDNFLNRTFEDRRQLNTQDIYEILYREFGKEEMLIPFFLSVIDSQQKRLLSTQKRIAELENELNRKD